MKITYDPLADAMYIHFNDLPVKRDEELEKDIIMDYAAHNVPVGLEILSVSKKIPKKALKSVQFKFNLELPKQLSK